MIVGTISSRREREREREDGNVRPTDQESGVLDDAELLGPLPQPLLAPQEGADAGVTHQLDAGLGGGPLVGGRLASAAFLLIIGLIGAAHRLSILCKEDALGHSPARQGAFLSTLVHSGGRAAGSRQEQPLAPRSQPTCPSRPLNQPQSCQPQTQEDFLVLAPRPKLLRCCLWPQTQTT